MSELERKITANRLSEGGTIGLICPSHVADMSRYSAIISAIERRGYRVKLGKNFAKDTYGYAASAAERADDLNELAADSEVQMILFGGGETAVELLPYIDYANIRRNPKIFSSYSDGTSILNAIRAQTGLVTYYGFGAGEFADLRYYDYMQFRSHFAIGCEARRFESDSEWRVLRGGACEGTLIGGYLSLVALMLGSEYFSYDPTRKYLLFLEDHERFSNVGAVSTYLAFISQHAFMRSVTGVIFGHYSQHLPDDLASSLERFGERHGIPVVYTDDFGHGTRHAIFPIGVDASLDADKRELVFPG